MAVAALNSVAMMYFVPLVLKEGMVNAVTRQALETSIARQLQSFPAGRADPDARTRTILGRSSKRVFR